MAKEVTMFSSHKVVCPDGKTVWTFGTEEICTAVAAELNGAPYHGNNNPYRVVPNPSHREKLMS